MIWFYVVVDVCLGLAAYSFIFFKSFLLLFLYFFCSYSFLCAVLWWPVQWAFVAFLVTWNKYDDDDDDAAAVIVKLHSSHQISWSYSYSCCLLAVRPSVSDRLTVWQLSNTLSVTGQEWHMTRTLWLLELSARHVHQQCQGHFLSPVGMQGTQTVGRTEKPSGGASPPSPR